MQKYTKEYPLFNDFANFFEGKPYVGSFEWDFINPADPGWIKIHIRPKSLMNTDTVPPYQLCPQIRLNDFFGFVELHIKSPHWKHLTVERELQGIYKDVLVEIFQDLVSKIHPAIAEFHPDGHGTDTERVSIILRYLTSYDSTEFVKDLQTIEDELPCLQESWDRLSKNGQVIDETFQSDMKCMFSKLKKQMLSSIDSKKILSTRFSPRQTKPHGHPLRLLIFSTTTKIYSGKKAQPSEKVRPSVPAESKGVVYHVVHCVVHERRDKRTTQKRR